MKFTYLFTRKSDGLTKIGRTASPADRIKSFGGEAKMIVVGVIPRDCESELHRKHAEHRVAGEWFRLPPEVLADYASKHGVPMLPGKDFLTRRNPDLHATLYLPISLADLSPRTRDWLLAKSARLQVNPIQAPTIWF